MINVSYGRIMVLFIFLFTLIGESVHYSTAYAEIAALPKPGTILSLSDDFSYPVLKGLKIDRNNPMNLNFVVDSNEHNTLNNEIASKLVSYFLAALTIDKSDIWVNLSPYEQDRVIDSNLAITDLGKDLLEQDYILKQLSASLTHPDTLTGKKYWASNSANFDLSKIWIIPDKVRIYENGDSAFVTELSLEVQCKNEKSNTYEGLDAILAEVKLDINQGKNFSQLRQIFYSIALAQWFKAKLENSFFRHYINKNKINGIDLDDKSIKDKIWHQYVESFEIGAYDIVAKVKDGNTGIAQKKKYFSGGASAVTLVYADGQSHERRFEGIPYDLMVLLDPDPTAKKKHQMKYDKNHRDNYSFNPKDVSDHYSPIERLNVSMKGWTEYQKLKFYLKRKSEIEKELSKSIHLKLKQKKNYEKAIKECERRIRNLKKKHDFDIELEMNTSDLSMEVATLASSIKLSELRAIPATIAMKSRLHKANPEYNVEFEDGFSAYYDVTSDVSEETKTILFTNTEFPRAKWLNTKKILLNKNVTLQEFVVAVKHIFSNFSYETEDKDIASLFLRPNGYNDQNVANAVKIIEIMAQNKAFMLRLLNTNTDDNVLSKWLSIGNLDSLNNLVVYSLDYFAALEYVPIDKVIDREWVENEYENLNYELRKAVVDHLRTRIKKNAYFHGEMELIDSILGAFNAREQETFKRHVRKRDVRANISYNIKKALDNLYVNSYDVYTVLLEFMLHNEVNVEEFDFTQFKKYVEVNYIARDLDGRVIKNVTIPFAEYREEKSKIADELMAIYGTYVENVENHFDFINFQNDQIRVNPGYEKVSSSVELIDNGGIDAQDLVIETETLSSSIEFEAFDSDNFNGFGFSISLIEERAMNNFEI